MIQASDEILMEAVKGDDEMALEQLIRRHGNDLLGYLFRMTADRSQSEDLLQESFIRVYTKARSYDSRRPFKPWLYAIATRLALDFLRRRGRYPTPVSLDASGEDSAPLAASLPAGKPDPSEEAGIADTRRQVLAALDILPPRQRAALTLAYYQGLTYPEVARTMKCSVGTIKTQMSRALRTLARVLPQPHLESARGGLS